MIDITKEFFLYQAFHSSRSLEQLVTMRKFDPAGAEATTNDFSSDYKSAVVKQTRAFRLRTSWIFPRVETPYAFFSFIFSNSMMTSQVTWPWCIRCLEDSKELEAVHMLPSQQRMAIQLYLNVFGILTWRDVDKDISLGPEGCFNMQSELP